MIKLIDIARNVGKTEFHEMKERAEADYRFSRYRTIPGTRPVFVYMHLFHQYDAKQTEERTRTAAGSYC